MDHSPTTTFLLNDERVVTRDAPGLLVLDYLRKRKRLVGTKEGCKEGDCGACGVMVGELIDDALEYRPVTSCLLPLGELQGKHLVSIEGLNSPDRLTPVQEAVVLEGGTQCGYCTPAIIVSMTHCLLERRSLLNQDDVKLALSGHLCRCTGYASLKRAGKRLEALFTESDRAGEDGILEHQLDRLIEKEILPPYFARIPARLRSLGEALSRAPIADNGAPPGIRIAGGTDLYVQQGEEIPDAPVEVLNRIPGLESIVRKNGTLEIGALTTFEQLSHDEEFRKIVPDIERFMFLIASLQIRNRATLSGNVINASPIGDMTILLLALEAEIRLTSSGNHRTLPLRDLYKGYKDLDKDPSELLTRFSIPCPSGETLCNFEKVSKRKCLDIASVNTAIRITLDGKRITGASLAVGGVAPIPKHCPRSSAFMPGKEVTPALVEGLLPIVQSEIHPISDVRGSADYKRLMTRQLVVAHFCRLFPEVIRAEAFL